MYKQILEFYVDLEIKKSNKEMSYFCHRNYFSDNKSDTCQGRIQPFKKKGGPHLEMLLNVFQK